MVSLRERSGIQENPNLNRGIFLHSLTMNAFLKGILLALSFDVIRCHKSVFFENKRFLNAFLRFYVGFHNS